MSLCTGGTAATLERSLERRHVAAESAKESRGNLGAAVHHGPAAVASPTVTASAAATAGRARAAAGMPGEVATWHCRAAFFFGNQTSRLERLFFTLRCLRAPPTARSTASTSSLPREWTGCCTTEHSWGYGAPCLHATNRDDEVAGPSGAGLLPSLGSHCTALVTGAQQVELQGSDGCARVSLMRMESTPGCICPRTCVSF